MAASGLGTRGWISESIESVVALPTLRFTFDRQEPQRTVSRDDGLKLADFDAKTITARIECRVYGKEKECEDLGPSQLPETLLAGAVKWHF
ncbi:MAG: hypothetical protein OXF56_26140 [Rhodobacteraceae bacterium]|nr:hypothetical protein [Paracoccaceae bacterium]